MPNSRKKPVTCATSLSELIDKLLKVLERHGDMTVALEIKEPDWKELKSYRTDADEIKVKLDSSWNDPAKPCCLLKINS